ncbi:MAG: polysaccharide polymerase [Burkholderiales bacterium]
MLSSLPSSVQNDTRPSVTTGAVSIILFAATTYQAVLCLIHTHFFRVNVTAVALAEFLVYLACLTVLIRRVRVEFVIVAALITAYLLLLSIFRGELELKGFRDVMIPILFYWLGRHVGNMEYADKILRRLIWVVLAFGFFEFFFLGWYSSLFNIFSYYLNQGVITVPSNFISGSALNLNGMRPEGIGRTILPSLLGSHRVSSIFLEPVSLGNFAVIVAAWGLAKTRAEWKNGLFFLAAAVVMITLSDSRYGIGAVSLMLLLRAIPVRKLNFAVSILPVICVASLVLIGLFYHGQYADNILGRLYVSGRSLLSFTVPMLLGVEGSSISFYDMGYPYILTRLSVLLVVVLWFAIWMMQMQDSRGERFRIYIALYISLILCVSGTSFFALKTAGILWFLVGSGVRAKEKQTTTAERQGEAGWAYVA